MKQGLLAPKYLIGAAVVVGALALWGGASAHRRASEALSPVSGAIGRAWASASMALNGSHKVEYTQGGFYLSDKYIDGEFRLSTVFVEAISNAHTDNAQIFAALLTPDGRIKPQYYALIDSTVTKADVGIL